MAKTLDFAYGTPHEVKVGDDETTFTLVCKNEDLLVDLTTAKSITAYKAAQASSTADNNNVQ